MPGPAAGMTGATPAMQQKHGGSCGGACRFEGPRCDIDIIECVRATAGCSANAGCTNSAGGFACACNWGYAGAAALCPRRPRVSQTSSLSQSSQSQSEVGQSWCAGQGETSHTAFLLRSLLLIHARGQACGLSWRAMQLVHRDRALQSNCGVLMPFVRVQATGTVAAARSRSWRRWATAT